MLQAVSVLGSQVAQVEDCLFRVPREPLEEESTVFADMFLLPQGEQVIVEGQSDENPIVLQGIEKDEFEPLLKALLYRSVRALNFRNNRMI